MHVVGARFRTLAAAGAALLAVRSAVPVAPGDAGVRPLGSTRYEEPADEYLLAGRFADEDVAAVIAIVESQGGRVIERRRDVPRASASPDRAGAREPRRIATSNPPYAASWAPPRMPQRAGPLQGARRMAALRSAQARKLLRRPSARLRLRAARAHRLG